MRRISKTDGNHQDITNYLRKLGCSVTSLHMVGNGCPDILIGIAGVNGLAEIKDPLQPEYNQVLTNAEDKWHKHWRGNVRILKTLDDCMEYVKWLTARKP